MDIKKERSTCYEKHTLNLKKYNSKKRQKYDASTNQEQFGIVQVVSSQSKLRTNSQNNKDYCIC